MRLTAATALLLIAASATPVSAQFAPPFPPPGLQGFPTAPNFGQPPLRINLQTTQDSKGYYLTINTGDSDPSAVKVDIDPRGLTIHNSQNSSREVSQASPPGQGYSAYSYSYSSSHSNLGRFIPLPADADSENATREDGEGKLVIFIPRRN